MKIINDLTESKRECEICHKVLNKSKIDICTYCGKFYCSECGGKDEFGVTECDICGSPE